MLTRGEWMYVQLQMERLDMVGYKEKRFDTKNNQNTI